MEVMLLERLKGGGIRLSPLTPPDPKYHDARMRQFCMSFRLLLDAVFDHRATRAYLREKGITPTPEAVAHTATFLARRLSLLECKDVWFPEDPAYLAAVLRRRSRLADTTRRNWRPSRAKEPNVWEGSMRRCECGAELLGRGGRWLNVATSIMNGRRVVGGRHDCPLVTIPARLSLDSPSTGVVLAEGDASAQAEAATGRALFMSLARSRLHTERLDRALQDELAGCTSPDRRDLRIALAPLRQRLRQAIGGLSIP